MPIHVVAKRHPQGISSSSTLAEEELDRRPAEVAGQTERPKLSSYDAALPPPPRGLRFGTGSLTTSPFLFSSRMAWAVLDFNIALFLATLAHLANRAHSPMLAPSGHLHAVLASLLGALPFAFLVMACSRLSRLHQLSEDRSRVSELGLIALSLTLAVFAVLGFQTLWNVAAQTPAMITAEAAVAGAAMFLGRVLWHGYRRSASRRAVAQRNCVIVGANPVGREVRNYLAALPYAGYRFNGFISLGEAEDDETAVAAHEIIGTIHDVITLARSRFVEEIIFSRRPSTPDVLSRVLRQARSVGIDIRLIPSLSETLNYRSDVQYIGNLPTITIFQSRHRKLSLLLKRTIDIAGASLASVALLPVFAAIAVAIKLQSDGPVLYVSERVGYKGRVFTCYKFRTMVANADALQAQIAHLNERSGVLFKISKDPRVTAVGAILRKYSLDELPQLWNVLRGDMSLVGPRPSISSEVAQYKTAHLRRLDVVPGITGLWQVEARQDPSFESYVKLDSEYVNGWSLWLDLKILARTIGAVIAGTGT